MKAGKFQLLYPTAAFGALLFVMGAMWYAASSQNSAAIYLLLFLLVSVFLVSIPHTLTNLAGVTLRVESAKPTFAGDEVCLPIEIINSFRETSELMMKATVRLVVPVHRDHDKVIAVL